MTNRATVVWEYENPPRIRADNGDLPCPNCGHRLQQQDRLNLACVECESGFGVSGQSKKGNPLLCGEFGHPAAEVVEGLP